MDLGLNDANIVGVVGPAGAGKNTFADCLLKAGPWNAELAFASNLKEMCIEVFELERNAVYSTAGKSKFFGSPIEMTVSHSHEILNWISKTHKEYVTEAATSSYNKLAGTIFKNGREVLQTIGVGIRQSVCATYHVDIVSANIDKENFTIITDVRFKNEASRILEMGGIIVKITRDGPCNDVINRFHLSEVSMSTWTNYDIIVNNPGTTIADFEKDIIKKFSIYNERSL